MKIKSNTTSTIMIIVSSVIIGFLIAALCNTFEIISYVLLGYFTAFFVSEFILGVAHFQGEEW